MRDLLRVWRRIEALPVTAGVELEWRQLLGDDLALIEPFLMPEKALATVYPCPHPVHDDCPRRVIHHTTDEIVAVCGNASPQCERLRLTRRDLVVRSLKIKEWCRAVTRGLREANGLEELELETPAGVVALGVLARRRKRLPVVWLRSADHDIELLVRGLRTMVAGDGLLVVLPPATRAQVDRLLSGGIVLLSPPATDDGDLALCRALDLLDPSYRQTRIADPLAIFDDVALELATEPGVRHVVRINGHELGGFQRSNVKFARLLYLAAARAADPDVEGGGWVKKTKIQDDDKNHETEAVRAEFEKGHHPQFSAEELKELVKTSPKRNGTVRLALRPERIRFDESLAGVQPLAEDGATEDHPRTRGGKERAANLRQGRVVAEELFAAARKFSVLPVARGRG